MPAICNNVKAVEGNGFTSRTLVYDKNEARSVERYKNTCPTRGLSAWKQVHTCPEPNQPGVINAQGGPSRPGPIGLANPALPRTNPAAFEILLPLGMPPSQKGSGLRYSCDEYPPKKYERIAIFMPALSNPSASDLYKEAQACQEHEERSIPIALQYRIAPRLIHSRHRVSRTGRVHHTVYSR